MITTELVAMCARHLTDRGCDLSQLSSNIRLHRSSCEELHIALGLSGADAIRVVDEIASFIDHHYPRGQA